MGETNILLIPTELLILILSYACVDSGKTGYALNLVCKSFKMLCWDTALDIQSVALHGASQMCQFLEMLDRRPERLRRVKSLFLSTFSSGGFGLLRANEGA